MGIFELFSANVFKLFCSGNDFDVLGNPGCIMGLWVYVWPGYQFGRQFMISCENESSDRSQCVR